MRNLIYHICVFCQIVSTFKDEKKRESEVYLGPSNLIKDDFILWYVYIINNACIITKQRALILRLIFGNGSGDGKLVHKANNANVNVLDITTV